jgi:hypothetical protein
VYGSVVAAIIFSFLCIAGFTLIDGMNGGFALAFVSLLCAISSVAVAGLFTYHALVMDSILSSTRVLAHWTYPDADAALSAEREFRDYRERNRALFLVVGGMLGAVALFFLVFVEDGGVETAAVLFVILMIIFIISRIAPILERNRAEKTSHEAYIAENGIIYEGAVYPFRSFMMKMDGVRFKEGDRTNPPVIIFSFIQLIGLYIIQPFEIAIPVPLGKEDMARGIAKEVGGEE